MPALPPATLIPIPFDSVTRMRLSTAVGTGVLDEAPFTPTDPAVTTERLSVPPTSSTPVEFESESETRPCSNRPLGSRKTPIAPNAPALSPTATWVNLPEVSIPIAAFAATTFREETVVVDSATRRVLAPPLFCSTVPRPEPIRSTGFPELS